MSDEIKDNLSFSSTLSYSSGKGDWIPDMYKSVFKTKDGCADLVVCHVFSKILYWHMPGKTGKKKYGGKLPFLSSSILADQLSLSLKQVRRAMEVLENKYNVIIRTRSGRKTHVNLNKDNLKKLFLPYMAEIGTEDILLLSNKSDREESHEPSRANEDRGQMPSRANEPADTCPPGPTYNIKKNHKLKTESNVKDYPVLESEYDKSLFALKMKSMTKENYKACCKSVVTFVSNQLCNGSSKKDVLEKFLLNPLLDQVSYPAFARLNCVVMDPRFSDITTEDLKKILYVVKGECAGNPDLSKMLLRYCPDVDYASVDLDLNRYVYESNNSLSKIFDTALMKAKGMENSTNED